MARTSVENTIERIRRQLSSTVRQEVNVLGSTLTSSTNPVTLAYDLSLSLRPGTVLSIGTELMRVISINTSSKEVTVIRGWQDTDAEAHDTGAEVLISPRFTRFDIFDAMIAEIDAWAPDIFTTLDAVYVVTDSTAGVEVHADHATALGVVSCNRNWSDDDSAVWPDLPFNLYRGRSASLTPTEGSGMFVRFTANLGRTHAGEVAIRYAIPIDPSTLTEDSDLLDVFIQPQQLEIIELGVKARLLADDEAGRTARNAQDEPRRNEEVQAGQALTLAQTVLQRHGSRKAQEVRRLRTIYPFQSW